MPPGRRQTRNKASGTAQKSLGAAEAVTEEDLTRLLKSELDASRRAIVGLMRHEVQNLLLSFYLCKSESQWDAWPEETAQKVVGRTEAQPPGDMGEYLSRSPRALCPLCGDSTKSPYGGSGFAIPEGLLRHLLGSHTSRQCDVFGAACALAIEHRQRYS